MTGTDVSGEKGKKEEPQNLADRKLALEIEALELRNRSRWERISAVVPLITTLVAVAGLFLSVALNVLQQRTHATEVEAQVQQDFKKPFWEKMLDTYFEASDVVSILATASTDAERQKAEVRFRQLFYGQLVIVEDEEIANAMVAIRGHLDECKTPSSQSVADKCSRARLLNLSLALSSACRDAIAKEWKQDLSTLKGLYHVEGNP